MDSSAYAAEAEAEATHWWFAGRRKLFAREITDEGLAKASRVLDIGTSTGTNLRMLAELGFRNVQGLDLSPAAISYCAEKGLGEVALGDVCNIPFEDGTFDLVLATDIIEHVDDDAKALSEMRRVLKPGGKVIITVPAFGFMKGLQDRVAQHKRRYVRSQLLERAANAGLNVSRSYYFNYLLFLPTFVARRLIDLFRIKARSENDFNTTFLNRILERIFVFDVMSARRITPPFGVSIFVIAERPAAAATGGEGPTP